MAVTNDPYRAVLHGVGVGADVDAGGRPVKYVKLYGAGVLLGRGHLICKCSVEAGRLLSLVSRPGPDSRQRGQYFNLHLHLKLLKG